MMTTTKRLCLGLIRFTFKALVNRNQIEWLVPESPGLGQSQAGPSRGRRLWPGLEFLKTKAAPGQAKAGAFRPSRAGTSLIPGP
jgi:hypothetical protein